MQVVLLEKVGCRCLRTRMASLHRSGTGRVSVWRRRDTRSAATTPVVLGAGKEGELRCSQIELSLVMNMGQT